ncbi:hypothetical protein HanIR_Chr08g0350391 [Helianthus annuus]|nr:hypothetical protein HanIR_Chr08g0350391 [Helianthus annuus]
MLCLFIGLAHIFLSHLLSFSHSFFFTTTLLILSPSFPLKSFLLQEHHTSMHHRYLLRCFPFHKTKRWRHGIA